MNREQQYNLITYRIDYEDGTTLECHDTITNKSTAMWVYEKILSFEDRNDSLYVLNSLPLTKDEYEMLNTLNYEEK